MENELAVLEDLMGDQYSRLADGDVSVIIDGELAGSAVQAEDCRAEEGANAVSGFAAEDAEIEALIESIDRDLAEAGVLRLLYAPTLERTNRRQVAPRKAA